MRLSVLCAASALAAFAASVSAGPAENNTCEPQNIACGKPATASSEKSPGHAAARAVDGNSGSHWWSDSSGPQWLQVDLGAPHVLRAFELRWAHAYARGYRLLVSDDAASWRDAYATEGGSGGTERHDVPAPAAGRFVRLLATAAGQANQKGYALRELRLFGTPAAGPVPLATDLSVHSISRTPRYPSYQNRVEHKQFAFSCCYDQYPTPGTEDLKRWPDPGEAVQFTARVVNQGASPGPFSYRWSYDGQVVGTGQGPTLEPGGSAEVAFERTWEDGDHEIEFALLRVGGLSLNDEHSGNDVRRQRTNALTVAFYLWPNFVEYMKNHDNAIGTRSGEDWLAWHVDAMNRLFESSIYPSQPHGVRLRVAMDEFVYLDAAAPDPGGNHAPTPCPVDACYGFGGPDGSGLERIDEVHGTLDTGLLHEFAHQLGLIDLYQMDLQDFKLLIDEHPRAELFADTGAGREAQRLFDGDSTPIPVEWGRECRYVLRFDRPRAFDEAAVRLETGDTWQLYSGPDVATVLGNGGKLRASVGWKYPVPDIVPIPGDAAPVWMLTVSTPFFAGFTRVGEWELYEGGAKVDIAAELVPFDPVAGTSRMPYAAWDVVRYNSAHGLDLMTGGTPYALSEFHVWALNRDAEWNGRAVPMRRGYFGRYLVDAFPKEVTLLLRDAAGQPVPDVPVEIFQQQDNLVPNVPKYRGTTGPDGRFRIPHTPTPDYAVWSYGNPELATPNPFSTVYSVNPDVVGRNGTLVIAVHRGSEIVYRFLDIPQVALERARGNLEEGAYPIDVP